MATTFLINGEGVIELVKHEEASTMLMMRRPQIKNETYRIIYNADDEVII